MVDAVIKIVIFIALLSLGGYFVVIFHRRYSSFSSKDYSGGSEENSIKILQRVPIGYRQVLAVVKCGHQRFLIGISPGRIDSIGEIGKVASKDDFEGDCTSGN